MSIRKYGKYWAVYDATGALVRVTMYKHGVQEVVRQLQRSGNLCGTL